MGGTKVRPSILPRLWVSVVIFGWACAVPSSAKMDLDTVVGMWLLDEEKGKTALDSSGHERHGKHQGDVGAIDGRFGKGLELFGGGEGVVIAGLGDWCIKLLDICTGHKCSSSTPQNNCLYVCVSIDGLKFLFETCPNLLIDSVYRRVIDRHDGYPTQYFFSNNFAHETFVLTGFSYGNFIINVFFIDSLHQTEWINYVGSIICFGFYGDNTKARRTDQSLLGTKMQFKIVVSPSLPH